MKHHYLFGDLGFSESFLIGDAFSRFGIGGGRVIFLFFSKLGWLFTDDGEAGILFSNSWTLFGCTILVDSSVVHFWTTAFRNYVKKQMDGVLKKDQTRASQDLWPRIRARETYATTLLRDQNWSCSFFTTQERQVATKPFHRRNSLRRRPCQVLVIFNWGVSKYIRIIKISSSTTVV